MSITLGNEKREKAYEQSLGEQYIS